MCGTSLQVEQIVTSINQPKRKPAFNTTNLKSPKELGAHLKTARTKLKFSVAKPANISRQCLPM